MSILEWQIMGSPLAIIDVETTGFNPGHDRIVEVSVVHLAGDRQPELVFDSLVDPRRAIPELPHRITTEDVSSAPIFSEIARTLIESLCGRILVAHNAAFDIRFLASELHLLGIRFEVPYLCTMNLRPVLGLGDRATLEEACQIFGIELRAHRASEDALATGALIREYGRIALQKGIRNFGDLAGQMGGSAVGSWSLCPMQSAVLGLLPNGRPPRSRADRSVRQGGYRRIDYTTALLEALADLVITTDELERLRAIREAQKLPLEQIRAAHAGVFTWMITRIAADGWVDEVERQTLARLHQCLSDLGWAPGQ